MQRSAAPRPILFDLTHLVSRLPRRPSSGIDRIDLAYAGHFVSGSTAAALHYGLKRPHLIPNAEARNFVALSASLWSGERCEAFRTLRDALAATPGKAPTTPRANHKPAHRIKLSLRQLHGRLLHDRTLRIPDRAICLNVAQHLFEYAFFFDWLDRRDDLCAVFMLHDLLPIDFPEYFSAANLAVFRRRLATAIRHADVFLVSTEAVKARLERELRQEGARPRPIHVQPFASPLEDETPFASASAPSGYPYFVTLGTIEPRKNHLLLLHVWRRLVAQNRQAPRLVIVGARGWENEQVADILDRGLSLKAHVVEISRLPSADLAELRAGARALLAPSFGEGYGLPVVEALALGTPVVASDIPVFREVAQGRATFLSPIDGLAWMKEILRLAEDDDYHAQRRAEARRFVAPTWGAYFDRISDFLASL